eukprot:1427421-Amphidinium_carterae.3
MSHYLQAALGVAAFILLALPVRESVLQLAHCAPLLFDVPAIVEYDGGGRNDQVYSLDLVVADAVPASASRSQCRAATKDETAAAYESMFLERRLRCFLFASNYAQTPIGCQSQGRESSQGSSVIP